MLKAITRRANAVKAKVDVINAQRDSQLSTTLPEPSSQQDLQPTADTTKPPPISIAYFFDHLAAEEDIAVVVEEGDFLEAQRELVPSVSMKELEHYERVRMVFEQDDGKEKRNEMSNGDNLQDEITSRISEMSLGRGEKDKGKANGTAVKAKGKGKARAFVASGDDFRDEDFGFGNAIDGDEDLYS